MKSLTSCSDLRKIHSCSFTAYDSLITMITFNGIRFVGRFHCLEKVSIKSLTLFTTHCKMIIWFISLQNCLQCELNRKTNIQKPQKRFRCTNSKFDTRKILQKRLVMDFFPQAPSPPPSPSFIFVTSFGTDPSDQCQYLCTYPSPTSTLILTCYSVDCCVVRGGIAAQLHRYYH